MNEDVLEILLFLLGFAVGTWFMFTWGFKWLDRADDWFSKWRYDRRQRNRE